jgi:aspartate kinase
MWQCVGYTYYRPCQRRGAHAQRYAEESRRMKVCKFGGSSVATAGQIDAVCRIVEADAERRIVVVSAPGKRHSDDTKVTDLLIALAEARLSGASGEEELVAVVARYAEIAEGLGVPASRIDPIAENLRSLIAASREDSNLFMDCLKAAGEDNCARLVAECLTARGVEAHYVGPREAGLVLSDEPGNAQVLQECYPQLAELANRPGVTVFPGFFGYSREGKLVTLPRGGSDTTGAVLASAVGADVYENFTDVDAVFAANPNIVDDPVPIRELTYREMRELSYAGFTVFHDEAIIPVFHAGIPIHIRNTNNPDGPGTRIVVERSIDNGPAVGIAAMDDVCSIYVRKYLMNREVGFGRRLLEILEDEGIAFEHLPSGIDDMSVLVREAFLPPDVEERVVGRIREELAGDDVSVEHGLSLVMIVGEGMRHTVGVAARACNALARAKVNIEMINQGSSEVSMMYGVKSEDVPRAVASLYQEYFG